MGRKKSASKSKPVFRPFCYYCDRDFDNEKVLIQHQKFKHFQCSYCHRKSDTGPGLINHMLQVHKDAVTKVPNSVPGREDPELHIHGMQGIPAALLHEKAKGTTLEDELIRRRIEDSSVPLDSTFPHMLMPPGMFPPGMFPPGMFAPGMLPHGAPFPGTAPPRPPPT